MKVVGELQLAQLEQIAATSATPAATGRVYMDVTTPTSAIPMIYNGTAWRQLRMGQTSLYSQNSGKAVTVNWANGLYQRVVLTDNCIISFQNPTAGEEHTLVVTQAAYATSASPMYVYKFNISDQENEHLPYQPNGVLNYSQNKVYKWYYQSGIRAVYATIPNLTFAASAAGTAAPATGDFSPDGTLLSIPHTSSPYNEGYRFSVNSSSPKPVLGRVIVGGTVAAAGTAVAFSTCGNFWAATSGTSPYLQIWKINPNESTFTTAGNIFSNPVTLPTGAGRCVAWHPASSHIAVGHTTTPFMSVYPISSAGFGTKLSDPATLPVAQVNAVAFAPTGDYLAVGSQTTPFIQVWPFTAATGSIGAAVANPGTLPAGGPAAGVGNGIAWRPQGDYIAMAMTVTPYLYVVPFDRSTGTFGTALSITALAGAVNSVRWTPDGQYLLCGLTASPYLYIYDFSSATIGTALTFDGSNPGQAVTDVVVHPSGNFAALLLTATPYVTGITLPNKVRNYLRLN